MHRLSAGIEVGAGPPTASATQPVRLEVDCAPELRANRASVERQSREGDDSMQLDQPVRASTFDAKTSVHDFGLDARAGLVQVESSWPPPLAPNLAFAPSSPHLLIPRHPPHALMFIIASLHADHGDGAPLHHRARQAGRPTWSDGSPLHDGRGEIPCQCWVTMHGDQSKTYPWRQGSKIRSLQQGARLPNPILNH